MEHGKLWNFLLGRTFLLKLDQQSLKFMFNARKGLPKVKSSIILRWAIKFTVFDFDTV